MQTLYFEDSWNETIAPTDRKKIIEQFNKAEQRDDIVLSFLWEAINHKKEKLITVLIHNNTRTSLLINNIPIAYLSINGTMKTNSFDVPATIPPKTSMPWTFIFSDQRHTDQQPHFIITLNKR